MKKEIFAEIGFGNKTFLSTEVEEVDEKYRVSKFILPKKINQIYFRFWIFKRDLIISTKNFIQLKKKPKNKLKIIFGIGGVGLK